MVLAVFTVCVFLFEDTYEMLRVKSLLGACIFDPQYATDICFGERVPARWERR
jgi:hypothetical protein